MDYFPVAPEDTESTDPITDIHRNIRNEPLLGRIRALEMQLMRIRHGESVIADMEAGVGRLLGKAAGGNAADTPREKDVMEELLKCFKELLATRYGSLGYLVNTTSEDIKRLYGVDTDEDFYFMDGASLRIPNTKLDAAVASGGGRRFGMFGERGLIVYDPAETPLNARLTHHAVQEIIASIESRLKKLQSGP